MSTDNLNTKAKRTLGVTGLIGSGKTCVCNFLKELGATVISADEIAHSIINTQCISEKLCEAFGDSIKNENGINRSALGKIVFNNPDSLKALNDITHPAIVLEILSERLNALNSNCPLVVLDVPLLFETGLNKICDCVWFITASEETKQARINSRDGLGKTEANKRIAARKSDSELKKFADTVIENNGSLSELSETVKTLFERLVL